jgi:hypothetical protein
MPTLGAKNAPKMGHPADEAAEKEKLGLSLSEETSAADTGRNVAGHGGVSPELPEITERYHANTWKTYNSYAGGHAADCRWL